MTHPKKNTGFTLIELLVVISIISLLISILLPSLAKAREASIRIQCASRQRQVGMGLYGYTSDFDGWLPLTYLSHNRQVVGAFGNWDGSGYYDKIHNLGLLHVASTNFNGSYPNTKFKPDGYITDKIAKCPTTEVEYPGYTYAYGLPTLVTHPGSYRLDDVEANTNYVFGQAQRKWSVVAACWGRWYLGATSSTHKDFGTNTLYLDGHVSWYDNSYAPFWPGAFYAPGSEFIYGNGSINSTYWREVQE